MTLRNGNQNALRHGAHSTRVMPLAAKHARRLLRQRGVRASDLSPLGRQLLRNWARASAMLDLLDAYYVEHGLLRADGEPQPSAKLYIAAVNAERHALRALGEHLQTPERDPLGDLDAYLERKHDGGDDE